MELGSAIGDYGVLGDGLILPQLAGGGIESLKLRGPPIGDSFTPGLDGAGAGVLPIVRYGPALDHIGRDEAIVFLIDNNNLVVLHRKFKYRHLVIIHKLRRNCA